MSLATALILAAATAASALPVVPNASTGAQVVSVQARATIVGAVIVRQASGLQHDRDRPKPQISRRGRNILVEFE